MVRIRHNFLEDLLKQSSNQPGAAPLPPRLVWVLRAQQVLCLVSLWLVWLDTQRDHRMFDRPRSESLKLLASLACTFLAKTNIALYVRMSGLWALLFFLGGVLVPLKSFVARGSKEGEGIPQPHPSWLPMAIILTSLTTTILNVVGIMITVDHSPTRSGGPRRSSTSSRKRQ